MKIREILNKRKVGDSFSSERAEMYSQTPETLAHWLFIEDYADENHRGKLLQKILNANDWKIDKEQDADE